MLNISTTIRAHLFLCRVMGALTPFKARCGLCSGRKCALLGPKENPISDSLQSIEPSLCGHCLAKFRYWFTRSRGRKSDGLPGYQEMWDNAPNINDAKHVDIVSYIAHLVSLKTKPKWLLYGHGTTSQVKHHWLEQTPS